MADFLRAAKKTATESINVAGFNVQVKGLSVKELDRLSKGKDPDGIAADLIVACCFDEKGNQLIPNERKGEVGDMSPIVFKELSEAVARVNGFSLGNSSATGGEGSSSD